MQMGWDVAEGVLAVLADSRYMEAETDGVVQRRETEGARGLLMGERPLVSSLHQETNEQTQKNGKCQGPMSHLLCCHQAQ